MKKKTLINSFQLTYQSRKQKNHQTGLHNLVQNQNENLEEHLDKIFADYLVLFVINTNKQLPKQRHVLSL